MLPIEIVYTVTRDDKTFTYTINQDDIERMLIKEHSARKNRVDIKSNDSVEIIDII